MSRGTILLVEDQLILRFIIEKQLDSAGFDIIPAENGKAALSKLETVTPDLVLLNIQLPPGMDGIAVCKRIRADKRLAHLPVIFLTARKDAESRALCSSVGANDYITKPWESSDLIARVIHSIEVARNP